MPKACPVCVHPERQEIEKALLAGNKLPDIAQRFALSKWAVFRHKQRHLSASLLKASEARGVARADSLLEQVKSLQGKALGLLAKAEAAGDLRTALQGVRYLIYFKMRACVPSASLLQAATRSTVKASNGVCPSGTWWASCRWLFKVNGLRWQRGYRKP